MRIGLNKLNLGSVSYFIFCSNGLQLKLQNCHIRCKFRFLLFSLTLYKIDVVNIIFVIFVYRNQFCKILNSLRLKSDSYCTMLLFCKRMAEKNHCVFYIPRKSKATFLLKKKN